MHWLYGTFILAGIVLMVTEKGGPIYPGGHTNDVGVFCAVVAMIFAALYFDERAKRKP